MIGNAYVEVTCDNCGHEEVFDLEYLSHGWADLSEYDLQDSDWVTVDDNKHQFCSDECAAEYFSELIKE